MRSFRHLIASLLWAIWLLAPARAHAGDPYIEWYTLTTPHFRVHFHGGLDSLAQRVGNIAEKAHRALVPLVGWAPAEITEIVIADDSDAANGSASTLPYNSIRLYATAPDDMSPLADYDDWLTELVTHEYTHVLHIDNTGGLPAAANAIFGKTFAPNQAQPHWIREGLAVLMESAETSGGRLRSTQFEMYLRADVLEGRLARLDEMSNFTRRWPGGNLWYLYGSKFMAWIADIYGPSTFAAVATDYGRSVIPWGINRAIRRATGRTYEELYAGWKASLERRYAAQVAAIRARGLREGKRLTHRGRVAMSPRFMGRCSPDKTPRLLYYRDDGETRSGFYSLPLKENADDEAELVARASGHAASWDEDCALIFESTAPSRRKYFFGDLFRLPHGVRATSGQERTRERLTIGRRARDPDVSRDGRRIVYVTNQAGTTTLRIADLTVDHQIANERRLVPSARFEQAYSPRFSPDGRHVAYSAWTAGGFRDIRIVDVASGTFVEPFRDRAIDQQPSWSPDGRTLYFASDRSGVANIYAFDLDTKTLHQVTNVTTGAYMPAVSPDGKTLVYVGYTSSGFDLYTLPIDRTRWLSPPQVLERHGESPRLEGRRWPVKRYSALPSLRPRRYALDYGPGAFGNALSISTDGNDAVGLHAIAAEVIFEFEVGEPQISVDYWYGGLPFAFNMRGFRSVSPRRDYRYGESQIAVREELIGLTNGISYGMPGEYDGQSAALSYTLARFHQDLPVGTRGDPYAPVPVEPHRGYLGMVHLGYSYSSAEATAYAISAERGLNLALGGDFANPAWGSETTLTAFTGVATAYLLMPWFSHHVLAVALSGGAAIGTYPRRGLYAIGGFQDLPILDAYTSGVFQSAFVLRGYEPSQFIGRQFNLLNAEYRFPLVYADRGLSTLPMFLRGLSGNLFADYGGAYDELVTDDLLSNYQLGVGAELWVDLVLGYYAAATIRVGVAKGTDSQAPKGIQTYTAISATF